MKTPVQHPSAYELDCYSANVLPADTQCELKGHLQYCDACRSYLEALETERQDLKQQMPAKLFAQTVRRRAEGTKKPACGARMSFVSVRTWRYALVGTFVLAGVLLILFIRPSQDSFRLRGDFQFNVYLKHQDFVALVMGEARVEAGDSVRFKLNLPQEGFISIFFLEEQGSISWYIPKTEQEPAMQIQRGETMLPQSARFDDSSYDEWAFVIFRKEPFVPDEEAQHIRASWLAARGHKFGNPAWLPELTSTQKVYFRRK